MKKFVVFLLLPLYLLSVPGLAYSLHFCSEKLTSFSLVGQKPQKSCPCKKSPSPSDCCDDKQVSEKTDESRHTAHSFKLDGPKLGLLTALLPQFLARLFPLPAKHTFPHLPAFVPLPKNPVYLRIGAFLI